MKKRVLSALLTVVMILTVLMTVCVSAYAAEIVNVEVGQTYTNELLKPVTSETEIGMTDLSGVVRTKSSTANGITLTATLSEDSKTLNMSYSGTPQTAEQTELSISYSTGGVDTTHTVTFVVTEPEIEIAVPNIVSQRPEPQVKCKQSDTSVEFSVQVSGEAGNNEVLGTISYEWKVDGVMVATGNKFTLVPADMTVGEHIVVCKVNNTVENTTKHNEVQWNVTVEKSAAPQITSTPSSASIEGTGSVDFVVKAEGTNLKYQWFMVSGTAKEKVVDGKYGAIEYTGATTDKLTVKCTMAPQNASTKFVCEVTGDTNLKTVSGEYILNITEDPNAEKVQKIEVSALPDKTEYFVGETIDEYGMKITVTTGKGTEEITDGFVCSPLYLEEEGSQTITVSYGGKTTTFTVTVNKAPHEHSWSEWKVDNSSTPVKVYRECIAGDDCTAKESILKDSFIVQYPSIADKLGLTMDDKTPVVDKNDDVQDTETDGTVLPDDTEITPDKDKKGGGNAILWLILIIALILLAGVVFYYFKVYRKPYKKPNSEKNNNRR